MSRNALIRCMHSDLSRRHKLFPLLSRCLHHHFWHDHLFYLTSVKEQYAFLPRMGCLNIKFQEELLKQCRWHNIFRTKWSIWTGLGEDSSDSVSDTDCSVDEESIILLQPWIWLQGSSSFSSQASWSFIILISVLFLFPSTPLARLILLHLLLSLFSLYILSSTGFLSTFFGDSCGPPYPNSSPMENKTSNPNLT
mgnify:CR=1 FL=1